METEADNYIIANWKKFQISISKLLFAITYFWKNNDKLDENSAESFLVKP